MAKTGPFTFAITDIARFLGKSPVTIRGWEKQGLTALPREGVERRVTGEQLRCVAHWAYGAKRISEHRLHLIDATVTIMTQIESDNSKD